jgi:hypothetical protein
VSAVKRDPGAAVSQSASAQAQSAPGAAAGRSVARRKFLNQPIEIIGIKVDSKAEAKRYDELRFMLRNGVIRDLEVHPTFPLVIHEQNCGVYEADFAYVHPDTGERVVEDVKSPATRKLPTYRLKARMVWALYGLKIREVMA